MLLASIIQRPGGSVIPLDTASYHFKPDETGAHVAEVSDERHLAIFFNIRQGDGTPAFVPADGTPVPWMPAPAPVAPLPAPVAQTTIKPEKITVSDDATIADDGDLAREVMALRDDVAALRLDLVKAESDLFDAIETKNTIAKERDELAARLAALPQSDPLSGGEAQAGGGDASPGPTPPAYDLEGGAKYIANLPDADPAGEVESQPATPDVNRDGKVTKADAIAAFVAKFGAEPSPAWTAKRILAEIEKG